MVCESHGELDKKFIYCKDYGLMRFTEEDPRQVKNPQNVRYVTIKIPSKRVDIFQIDDIALFLARHKETSCVMPS